MGRWSETTVRTTLLEMTTRWSSILTAKATTRSTRSTSYKTAYRNEGNVDSDIAYDEDNDSDPTRLKFYEWLKSLDGWKRLSTVIPKPRAFEASVQQSLLDELDIVAEAWNVRWRWYWIWNDCQNTWMEEVTAQATFRRLATYIAAARFRGAVSEYEKSAVF